jgi:hypothetical protein
MLNVTARCHALNFFTDEDKAKDEDPQSDEYFIKIRALTYNYRKVKYCMQHDCPNKPSKCGKLPHTPCGIEGKGE